MDERAESEVPPSLKLRRGKQRFATANPSVGGSEDRDQRSDVTQKSTLRLEIAHVLFIDIVGYSKMLIDEQSEAMEELNQMVRSTEAARAAEAAGQLVLLPTGDGMALVFTGSVE